jgi:hypothetical protein
MGLRYNGNLTKEESNVLIGYADSGFSVPRSQGFRLVIMNNAAISLTSKRHTTTDDSTTAAELTSCAGMLAKGFWGNEGDFQTTRGSKDFERRSLSTNGGKRYPFTFSE